MGSTIATVTLTNLQIRKASHAYLIPSQALSYDEQMIASKGKSMHKIKAKYKPIKEGYKMLALSDSGYVINFLFHSLIKLYGEYANMPLPLITLVPRL
jgi:hypothetical protein